MSSRPSALPPPGAADVLYLVDFSGYVFRAFHALPSLTNARGEPTHATLGFANMLNKLMEERKPYYLGVAVDMPGVRVREEMDARYKANRPPPPDELRIQLQRSRELVEAYGIPIFGSPGVEADDLIAVAVARAKEKGLRVVIAASDKDLMQLVDDERVVLWDTMREKVYGRQEVIAKFGVPPEQLKDLLALVGDTSDNIPGVPSIGMKTAAELLHQFGSIDEIYKRIDEVKKERCKNALKEHEADARISLELVTLRQDADVALDLESLRYHHMQDVERLRALFTELGFTRFVKMLPAASAAPTKLEGTHAPLLDEASLVAFADAAKKAGEMSIEVFTTSKEAMQGTIVGVALAARGAGAFYLPIAHRYLGAPAQLSLDTVKKILGPVISNPGVGKIGHDLKFSEVVLARNGVKLEGAVCDTMLASYLIDPEAGNSLELVAERDAGVRLTPLDAAPKKRGQPARGLEDFDVEEATKWAAAHADVELALADTERARLKAEALDKLMNELELPLARVLAEMELVGVLVDQAALEDLGQEMSKELAALEAKAREVAGADLNLASPKQLETILFDELGLKAIKKTKTGRSTDVEALEAIADEHPLPGIVLEHRAIAKLKGTYVDALPKLIHPETGRIHTRWSQNVAATGRLSSQDPNLQNIPIRTELGRMIRRAFVAPKGSVLVSADYSQIELRVLAHLSKDPVLVDAFQRGQDVHVRTAMEIFGVPAEGVTDEMRRRSKTVNFGVIYGMGETALAKRLSIPRAEAARFIETYFERYKGIAAFMEKTMRDAQKTETVHTLLGRRRILRDLRNTDRMRRAYAERIAQNTPIQGTAADLLKLAMVKLKDPVVPGARMILTVHDELVFEVPEAREKDARAAIQQAMETVFPMDVPLVVDVGAGKTWDDAE